MRKRLRLSATRRWIVAGVSLLPLLLTSCEKARYEGAPTYPVSGLVMIDGQPAEGVYVKLTPTQEVGSPDALTSQGVTDESGAYRLNTYVRGDGAPAGQYAVSLVWLEPADPPRSRDPGPDRLRRKYADPRKSQWQVEVVEGENVLETFSLTSGR